MRAPILPGVISMNARTPVSLGTLLLLVTACGGSDDAGSNGDNSCTAAPKTVVDAIAEGFTNSTFELHDAQMVAVSKQEQNDQGYPVNMVAGNITGSGGKEP